MSNIDFEYLKNLNEEQISLIPTDLLVSIIKSFSKELSRRQGKNPVQFLKEWVDKDPRRKVIYGFQKLDKGKMQGTIKLIDEMKNRYEESAYYESEIPTEKDKRPLYLKKPLKKILAEKGITLLMEGEAEIEKIELQQDKMETKF